MLTLTAPAVQRTAYTLWAYVAAAKLDFFTPVPHSMMAAFHACSVNTGFGQCLHVHDVHKAAYAGSHHVKWKLTPIGGPSTYKLCCSKPLSAPLHQPRVRWQRGRVGAWGP